MGKERSCINCFAFSLIKMEIWILSTMVVGLLMFSCFMWLSFEWMKLPFGPSGLFAKKG